MHNVMKLRQRGDTIVEVMIVLAVLGSALGISYSTANKSLLNARQAQESAEAAKLAQSQVESLYILAAVTNDTDPNYIFNDGETFCVSAGNLVKFPGSVTPASVQRDLDYDADYPAACKSADGLYHYSVKFTGADHKFNIVVVWDDVMGEGRDTVNLSYRIYPKVERDDI